MFFKRLFFILIVLILIISCFGCAKKPISQGDVWLTTDDNIKLKASIWAADGKDGVVFVHMMDRDRNDWKYFSTKLNKLGISAIGFDLRGHGGSEGDWKSFNSSDFNNMLLDIKAAKEKLESEGKNVNGIIGASIGANLALNFASKYNTKCVVLLSPGIDFKGVNVEDSIKNYKGNLLLVVSEEDSYSFESAKIIYQNSVAKKQLLVEKGLGHGSDMFKSEELQAKILDFISTCVK